MYQNCRISPYPGLYLGFDLHKGKLNRIFCRNIDRAILRSKMKRKRMNAIFLFEHRREQMLSCVLLHVVKTPWPIESQMNGRTRL